MYLRKLIVSLCILVGISLLLSGIGFWAQQNSEFHTKRNRIANQMLTEFISLRADKQRLKVWLAEYLLTEDANTGFRDTLFQRMQLQLEALDQLAIRDQFYSTSEADLQHIMQQVKVISLLQSNLITLENALKTREIAAYQDDIERWRTLIALFDKFQDTDLSELLQQAIAEQKQRAETTETDALHALQRVQLIMLLISLAGLLFAIVIGWHLSRSLSRPLQHLLAGTQQLQQGHFSHRIEEQGPKEFAELARQFNLMSGYIEAFARQEKQSQHATEQQVKDRTAELQHALAQLHHAEQRQKQLLADISHELRTPATSIQGEAEISLRGKDKDSSEYKEAFGRILAASQQLSRRIDDLLLLARGEERLLQVHLTHVPWQDFLQHCQQSIRQHLRSDTRFTLEPLPDLPASAWLLLDLDKFASVLRILTDNAQQYSEERPCLTLSITTHGSELVLELADQGIGLCPEDTSRLFQRHYRSAAARQARPDGLGIGLCIAKAIMEAQDGGIALLPNSPKGTRARLWLPLFTGQDHESTDY
ncbi:HAMP domain-containing sensor histidine kinase [Alkalimonas delamerensis]|uniref:histidine kinase n=1 Tax=Alkalimonas delamerensis TaxID=265981 RepID=A0ABT9GQ96_9GAMM|nr:HAMP domain-containing sensor histidine kinase [Alkalimonas delamerensis]MDP4529126.1 HAMP domain-containing sensor histidine kinase [Alkalimonas delamerensis]